MKSSAVAVPRRAATVLLLAASRHLGEHVHPRPFLKSAGLAPNDINILMERRHSKARFMPDTYVFPGGGVEQSDGLLARKAGFISGHESENVRVAWESRIAALRELTEETSCVLLKSGVIESSDEWRRRATGSDCDSFDVSAAAALTPIGHWVTPEDAKYRYDTYFYGAVLHDERAHGTSIPPQLVELHGQKSEISELLWVSPLEALVRHETESEAFSLPIPTFHVLAALARAPSFASVADAWRAKRQHAKVIADSDPAHGAEEVNFTTVTPRLHKGDVGPVDMHLSVPEQYFHNLGEFSALPRGHYTVCLDGTKGGAHAHVFVGDDVDAVPVQPITFLRK